MNMLDWLSRLIAYQTISDRSNLELIQSIEAWFKKYDIQYRLTFDDTKKKANIFGVLPAHDGNVQHGLVLSGHTDVVPVQGQKWDTDPFIATQREDKIYGRGACDMKGFVAVVLALIPQLKKINLKKPLYFAFTHDEETGGSGADNMIADFIKEIQPAFCIVGEPTEMKAVIAHKGIQVFHCRIKGLAAHSSLTPQGCNAIDYAAELIIYIRQLAEQIKKIGPSDKHFDVPFTTISTNKIHGGAANNIIPGICEFNFEFRHLPQVNARHIFDKINNYAQTELLPKMQLEYANAQIEISNVGKLPSFESDMDNKFVKFIQEITDGDNIHKVAYATEAGLFQEVNIPTIICGPGSIEQAHKPNEFVTIEQLKKCEAFLLEIIKKIDR